AGEKRPRLAPAEGFGALGQGKRYRRARRIGQPGRVVTERQVAVGVELQQPDTIAVPPHGQGFVHRPPASPVPGGRPERGRRSMSRPSASSTATVLPRWADALPPSSSTRKRTPTPAAAASWSWRRPM